MMPAHTFSLAPSLSSSLMESALSPRDDAAILKLWGETRDTLEIARRLGRPESQIANRLAQLRDEDGTAMTPTQYALHHARKQRLARLRAAAAKVEPKAEPKPVAATAHPDTALSAARSLKASHLLKSGTRAPWFHVARESEAPFMPAMPSAREIQNAVCAFYGVELREMLSPRRDARIVRPRQVAVYLCKQLTMLSMPKIGKLFGGRDHTTILASNRKIAALVKGDKELAIAIAALTEQLRRA